MASTVTSDGAQQHTGLLLLSNVLQKKFERMAQRRNKKVANRTTFCRKCRKLQLSQPQHEIGMLDVLKELFYKLKAG